MNFNLEVISTDREIFKGDVRELILPTLDGELTILARHMPLVVPLITGVVVVKSENKENYYSIGKGMFSITDNFASLLIEDVQSADEISEEKVIQAKQKAEELIKKGVSTEEKLRALNMIRRSLVDLKIVRKKKKTTQTL